MTGLAIMADEAGGYQADCGFGDVTCAINEFLVNTAVGFMNWLVDALTWAVGMGSITTDSPYWTNSINMSSFWLGIASFTGVVIMAAIGIVKGVLTGKREIVIRAVLGIAFAVPSTLISIWIVGTLLDATDALPGLIFEAAFGENMGAGLVGFLFPCGGDCDLSDGQQIGELVAMAMITGGGGGPALFIGLMLLMVLAVLVIIGINIVRNVLLQMLIAAAPLAFMMMPLGIGREIITSWAKMTAMVMLMKPMMTMYVGMMLGGMVNSGVTIWSVEGIPYVIGLALVVVVPFMVLGMFNFFGVDTDAGGREAQRAAGTAMSFAGRGLRGIRGGGAAAAAGGGGGRASIAASAARPESVSGSRSLAGGNPGAGHVGSSSTTGSPTVGSPAGAAQAPTRAGAPRPAEPERGPTSSNGRPGTGGATTPPRPGTGDRRITASSGASTAAAPSQSRRSSTSPPSTGSTGDRNSSPPKRQPKTEHRE